MSAHSAETSRKAQRAPVTNREWVVYALRDPESLDVRYVGITFRGIRTRWREHICRARTGGKSHRDRWIASLCKRDLLPVIEVLENGNGDGWAAAERRWIAEYRSRSGRLVNCTDGGEGTPGLIPSADLRARWSQQRKGRVYKHIRPGGMTGKRHSGEVRALIAAAGTGRTQSAEARQKLSEAHRGKRLSEDHRAKLGAAKRGKKLSTEHKAKIAASTTGRVPVLCVETGEIHPSVAAAANHVGVSKASLGQALRKGCRSGKLHWRRA